MKIQDGGLVCLLIIFESPQRSSWSIFQIYVHPVCMVYMEYKFMFLDIKMFIISIYHAQEDSNNTLWLWWQILLNIIYWISCPWATFHAGIIIFLHFFAIFFNIPPVKWTVFSSQLRCVLSHQFPNPYFLFNCIIVPLF